jgi:hypothetical protein
MPGVAILPGEITRALEVKSVDGRNWPEIISVATDWDISSLKIEDVKFSQLGTLTSTRRSLTHLNVSNTRVSDLTPLAEFRELSHLTADSTAVAEVTPLHGLNNLRTLSLRNTSVKELPALPRNLEVLDLAGTQKLDTIQLEGNPPHLKELWLENSNVSSVLLAKLEELEKLKLPNCRKLQRLELAKGLSNLDVLEVSSTRMTELSLEGLSGLTELIFNDNSTATEVSLRGFSSLTHLVIRRNPSLARLEIVDAPKLDHQGALSKEILINENPQLQSVDFVGCRLSESAINSLIESTKLERVPTDDENHLRLIKAVH